VPAPEVAPAPEPAPEPAPTPAEAAATVELGASTEVTSTEEVEAAGSREASGDEIIVTGTRIRRQSAFAPSAPVEVIDRKQLEFIGAKNLGDVVNYLTIAPGSVTAGATQNINLRGLGAGATLILLNGRRMNPSAGGIVEHTGDYSTVPLAAVERVEILKGGASAIYGSDAVGGVVNIITRKNWDGVRIELDGEATQNFDWDQEIASIAFGATNERARLTGAISYSRSTQLLSSERDFTEIDWDSMPIQGNASAQGFPGTFLISASGMADPDCAQAPNSRVIMGAFGPTCYFDFREFRSLLGNSDRAAAFANGEYDITNHTTLYAELGVSRIRGDSISSPAFPIPPPLPIVPADHVDNPFGVSVSYLGRPLGAEHGGAITAADDDTFRTAVGIKGDLEGAAEGSFLESFTWDVFATFGISRYRLAVPDTLRERFQEALNSCSDPRDLSGCFNPFYSSILGTGTPNSDEVIASFSGTQVAMTDHALQTYNAGMSGELFELPGGDLGIAFGGEIRHERRASELDHDANEEAYGFLLGNSDAEVDRDVHSGYLELVWPFYDGIEVQTAGRLDHYTDIDQTELSPGAGLTLVPAEIGGRENAPEALRKLQLRGHIARSFRAPTIYQSFPGFSTLPSLLTVPGTTSARFLPVRSSGNPDLTPERALAVSGGLLWSPHEMVGLTADLWYFNYEQRIAAQSAAGILADDYADDMIINDSADPNPAVGPIIDPLSGEISGVRTQQQNFDGVITSGLDFGLVFRVHGGNLGGSKDDFGTISLGTDGTYTFTYLIPQRDATQRVLPVGGTEPPPDCDRYSDPYEAQDGVYCDEVGKRNETNFAPLLPRLSMNFPLTWSFKGHMASFIGHFTTGVKDDNAAATNADGSFDEIDAWLTFDVQYGYKLDDTVGKALTLRVGCENLLDAEPSKATGLDGFIGDPRGRVLFAKLIQEF
jgi:iron complex outermembrane receptor protein